MIPSSTNLVRKQVSSALGKNLIDRIMERESFSSAALIDNSQKIGSSIYDTMVELHFDFPRAMVIVGNGGEEYKLNYDEFLKNIGPRLDLVWQKYRRRQARRCIQQRMRELGLSDYESYLEYCCLSSSVILSSIIAI